MKVLGSPIVPVPLPNEQRPDIVDRVQRSRTTNDARDQTDDSALRAFEQSNVNDDRPARPVAPSSDVSESFGRRVDVSPMNDQLPLYTRRALQTFAENSPSPEQQLGIELAGIDVIV